MDDRDRRAPITLTRNTPIAQTPGGFLLTYGFGDEVGERVEGSGGDVGGAGFEAVAVVGVAAFSDLDEEGVAVGGAGVGDELGDLGGGFEA